MTVRQSTLANGMRVVSEHMPHVETASLGVWVGVGTRHEAPSINGASHFLEHMAFKGTERRSARQIAEQIEAVGGHLNAYTSRENTAYYAKVLKEDVPLALDIVADILLHSSFDPAEFARERDVILQEIGQVADTPDDIIFDHFQATAFPDQPLGRPVLGTAEIIAGMKRESIVDYMRGAYHAGAMVLAAAGNVDHDRLVELGEAAFGEASRQPPVGFAPASYAGGEFRDDADLEQAHLAFGFPGVKLGDPDYYAAALFSTMLGGGMSSRLFQEVREKRGLVYSIYSFSAAYLDSGLFGIYCGTGAEQVRELVPVVFEQAHALADRIEDGELARARAQMKAGLLMSMEATGSRVEQLAQQILVYGRVLSVAEINDRLGQVDSAAIKRVAARILNGPLTLASLGPTGALESYDAMTGRLKAA
ncbi:MAG: M16 family metallopeptidase [Alphaproteobacteria bacterium]